MSLDPGFHDAWREFFATLPDGAHLLAIGASHDIVAQSAAEAAAAAGRTWDISATHALAMDADGHLPFAAEGFDAVVGQDALGQARAGSAALAGVHRLLKPGGDAQFIVGAADSARVQGARQSLQEAEFVLGEAAMFGRLRRLVTLEQASATVLQDATGELRASIHALRQRLQQARDPASASLLRGTLETVQALLVASRQAPPERIGRDIDRSEEVLRATAGVLRECVAHARTATEMAGLEQDAVAAGFTQVERAPLSHPGGHAGWQLLLHRA